MPDAHTMCAALMAPPSAKEVAEKLCGKSSAGCGCGSRAQGPSKSSEQVQQMRKVRDALMAKPLPELRQYAQGLRDRYAKLLDEVKQRPTFLSVPLNQYEGWLRELDGRLQASQDAAFAGQEQEAKRELVRLYFNAQTFVDRMRVELDESIDPIEYVVGGTARTVETAAEKTGDVLTGAANVAKGILEGSASTSILDRILPTFSTGTKVVAGLSLAAYLAAKYGGK